MVFTSHGRDSGNLVFDPEVIKISYKNYSSQECNSGSPKRGMENSLITLANHLLVMIFIYSQNSVMFVIKKIGFKL
jgi:hypothetical protein